MVNVKILTSAVLVLLLVFEKQSNADENLILLACNAFPPLKMLDSNGVKGGRDIEVLTSVAEHSIIDFKYVFYPWKRAYKKSLSGAVDGLCSCSYSKDRENDFYFTNAIGQTEIGIIFKSNSEWAPANLNDLTKSKVGVVLGYNLEKELQDNFINYTAVASEIQLIHLLINGRIDAAYTYKSPMLYYAKQEKLENKIKFSPIRSAAYYTCITKKSPNAQRTVQKINQSLKLVKENGEFKAIQSRYK